MSQESYELYENGSLDKDLDQLTKPLQKRGIDAAEFEVQADNQETLSQRITSKDRPHFEIRDTEYTTTEETELIVRLNSLTKSTNSGHLHLQNGNRVFYEYSGDDHLKLHAIFGTYSGPVLIRCRAKLNDQLETVKVEIFEIDRLQMELFDETSDPDPEQD